MRINKGDKLTNHSPIENDIKRVFFDKDSELNYGDFAVYIYIAMHIQYSEDGGKGVPNEKQGYCYKTKVEMCSELAISRAKLDNEMVMLDEYGVIAATAME